MTPLDSVLIATPDDTDRARMVALLNDHHYDTSSAQDVMTALARIAIAPPDLLVTVVRDGGFNGLPLVASGYARNPRMAALVLHDSPEAARDYELAPPVLGVIRHAARPADLQLWLRMVAETLSLRERRRWSRTRLAAPPAIATPHGRVMLRNVSYGGVRLQFHPRIERGLPSLVHLELPSLGLLLNVQRIWSHVLDPHAEMSCGAAVAPEGFTRTRRWRRLVDALRRSSPVLF